MYPWEASYQPLDHCPVYSQPFYFQQRTIICSLFGVVFTRCDAGLCSLFSLCCIQNLSRYADIVTSWSNPLGSMLLLSGWWERAMGWDGGAWLDLCMTEGSLQPCAGAKSMHSSRAPLSIIASYHGAGAALEHPTWSEPFSAPSLPAHSLWQYLFLVESFSYKWYLCNLARVFWWAGRIVH